ncbi:hypothetical protein Btru_066373 [Bulinus truncatus]|nr:hypothetical protein Btru_066373 [Bulinus truncatus]
MYRSRKGSTFPYKTKYDHNILVLAIFAAACLSAVTVDFLLGTMMFNVGLLMLFYFNNVRITYLLPLMLASLVYLIYISVECFCIVAIHYTFFITVLWIQSRYVE